MRFIPYAPQKTVTMSLLADKLTLAFFGDNLPGETQSSDCCLVSGMIGWIHISFAIMKRLKHFRIVIEQSHRLLWGCHIRAFVCERGTHLTNSLSYPSDYLNRSHWALCFAYGFHDMVQFQSTFDQDQFVKFFNCFTCCDLNEVVRAFGVNRACVIKMKFSISP